MDNHDPLFLCLLFIRSIYWFSLLSFMIIGSFIFSDQIKFLLKSGYDPNHRVYHSSHFTCSSFCEALKIRSPSTRIEILELFHKYGADVNAKDSSGRYVLTVATLTGDEEVLELILSYKPSKEAKIQGKW